MKDPGDRQPRCLYRYGPGFAKIALVFQYPPSAHRQTPHLAATAQNCLGAAASVLCAQRGCDWQDGGIDVATRQRREFSGRRLERGGLDGAGVQTKSRGDTVETVVLSRTESLSRNVKHAAHENSVTTGAPLLPNSTIDRSLVSNEP